MIIQPEHSDMCQSKIKCMAHTIGEEKIHVRMLPPADFFPDVVSTKNQNKQKKPDETNRYFWPSLIHQQRTKPGGAVNHKVRLRAHPVKQYILVVNSYSLITRVLTGATIIKNWARPAPPPSPPTILCILLPAF